MCSRTSEQITRTVDDVVAIEIQTDHVNVAVQVRGDRVATFAATEIQHRMTGLQGKPRKIDRLQAHRPMTSV